MTKTPAPKPTKKEKAVTVGHGLSISKKHSMALCRFIKYKSIEQALANLEEVLQFKKAVPFRGEIPHRRGKGMMSGRYPQNATKAFISLLKGLKGNAVVNSLDLEKTRILLASASWASRPHKRDGARFKRTHVIIEAGEIEMKEKKSKEKK